MNLLLVFAGGAVGAPTRYVVDRLIHRWYDSVFPWGTLVINVSGSFVLGSLAALHLSEQALTLLGTGFCGALTTFSTFGWETVQLLEQGALKQAALNVAGSVTLGILAALAGYLTFS
ncbi:fluoride efflux transporter CrcB [Streptosporangiaceae bacterium NEAU-GS5]|nr:fluoride efflux transporter CrcB [Streptosporangiaceae bacterium NEAU-GS5]